MANIRIALIDSVSKNFGGDVVKQLQTITPELKKITDGFKTIQTVLSATNNALGRIQVPKSFKDFSTEIQKQEDLSRRLGIGLAQLNDRYRQGTITQQKYTESVRNYRTIAEAQDTVMKRLSKNVLDSNLGTQQQVTLLQRAGTANKQYADSLKRTEASLKSSNNAHKNNNQKLKETDQATRDTLKGVRDLGFAFGVLGTPIGRVISSLTFLGSSLYTLGAAGVGVLAFMAPLVAAFKAFEVASAGVQKGIQVVVDVFAPFEQGIKNAASVMDNTESTFDQLGSAARRVALDFRFSSKEISEGFVILGRAGFDAGESLATIRSTAELAQATFSSLANATDLLTTTIRAFEDQNVTADRAAQVFAATTNKSKTSVESLRSSFNFVAVSAAQMGLSVEDVSALLGVLADKGLKASTQATGLRGVISSLLAPTDKFRAELEKVGLTIDDIDPRLIGIEGTLTTLKESGFDVQNAFAGLDRRVASAATALIASSDSFITLRDSITGTRTATEIAASQMETLQAKMDIAKNSVENLGISFGEQVAPAVKQFLDTFIELSSEGGPLSETVTRLAFMFNSVVNAGTAILAFLQHTDALSTGLNIFGGVLKTITGFLGLLVLEAELTLTAVGALASIIPGFGKLADGIKSTRDVLRDTRKDLLEFTTNGESLTETLDRMSRASVTQSEALRQQQKEIRESIGIRKSLIAQITQEFEAIDSATASTKEKEAAVKRLIGVLKDNTEFQTHLNNVNFLANDTLKEQIAKLKELKESQEEAVNVEQFNEFVLALTDVDAAFGGLVDKAEGLGFKIARLTDENKFFTEAGKETRAALQEVGSELQATTLQMALQADAFIKQSNGSFTLTDALGRLSAAQLQVSDREAAYIELVKQSLASLNGVTLATTNLTAAQRLLFSRMSDGNDELGNAKLALSLYREEFDLLLQSQTEIISAQKVFGDTVKLANGEVVNLKEELAKVEDRMKAISPLLRKTGTDTKAALAELSKFFSEAQRGLDESHRTAIAALNSQFERGSINAFGYFKDLADLSEEYAEKEKNLAENRLTEIRNFWKQRTLVAKEGLQEVLEAENLSAEERRNQVQSYLDAVVAAKKEEKKVVSDLIELQKKEVSALEDSVKKVRSLVDGVGGTITGALADLDATIAELSSSEGGIEKYRAALKKLEADTRSLKADTRDFNLSLEQLNSQYSAGALTTEEYNKKLGGLVEEYKELEERGVGLSKQSKDIATQTKDLSDEFVGQTTAVNAAKKSFEGTRGALVAVKEAKDGFSTSVDSVSGKLAQETGVLNNLNTSFSNLGTDINKLEGSFTPLIEKVKSVGVVLNKDAIKGIQDFVSESVKIDTVTDKINNLKDAAQSINMTVHTRGSDEVTALLGDIETTVAILEEDHELRVNISVDENLLNRILAVADAGASINAGNAQIPQGFNRGGVAGGASGKVGSGLSYGGGDVVPAALEKGEFVLRKEAARNLGYARLNMMNRTGKGGSDRYNRMSAMMLSRYLPMLRFAKGGFVSDKEYLELARKLGLNLNLIPSSFSSFASSLSESNDLSNNVNKSLVDLIRANSETDINKVSKDEGLLGFDRPDRSPAPSNFAANLLGSLTSATPTPSEKSKRSKRVRDISSFEDVTGEVRDSFTATYGEHDPLLAASLEGSKGSVKKFWGSLMGDKGVSEYVDTLRYYENLASDLNKLTPSLSNRGKPAAERIRQTGMEVAGEWFSQLDKKMEKALGVSLPNPKFGDAAGIVRAMEEAEAVFKQHVERARSKSERAQRERRESAPSSGLSTFGLSGSNKTGSSGSGFRQTQDFSFQDWMGRWGNNFSEAGAYLDPQDFANASVDAWRRHYRKILGADVRGALSEYQGLQGSNDYLDKNRSRALSDNFAQYLVGFSDWLQDLGYSVPHANVNARTPESFAAELEKLEKAYYGALRPGGFQTIYGASDVSSAGGNKRASDLDRNRYEKLQELFSFSKGTFSGDNIPAILERGEFVFNRRAVAAIGRQELEDLNKRGAFNSRKAPIYRHDGGYVDDSQGKKISSSRPVPTNPIPTGPQNAQKVVVELRVTGDTPTAVLDSWVRANLVPVLNSEIQRGSVDG